MNLNVFSTVNTRTNRRSEANSTPTHSDTLNTRTSEHLLHSQIKHIYIHAAEVSGDHLSRWLAGEVSPIVNVFADFIKYSNGFLDSTFTVSVEF